MIVLDSHITHRSGNYDCDSCGRYNQKWGVHICVVYFGNPYSHTYCSSCIFELGNQKEQQAFWEALGRECG